LTVLAPLPSPPSLHVHENAPLVGQLMSYASMQLDDAVGAFPWRFSHIPERQFNWLMAAGMGPLLYRGTWQQAKLLPEQWRAPLHGAHLTAQVVNGNLVDTANHVIDICLGRSVPVTLLKGISTSEEFYPAAHLRPMGDIDLLLPPDRYAEIEAALLQNNFLQPAYDHGEEGAPYHGPPLYDARRRVWVELHTSLFPSSSGLLDNTLFKAETIACETRPSKFRGRNVYRLSRELQLIYVASSWIRDMTTHRINPSFVPSLFDAIYLLKASALTMDWQRVVGLLDNELAAASLHVMLRFLERHRLFHVDARVMSRIAASQRLVGSLQDFFIQWMLDRNLAGGRYWNLAFPPPVPGRYSARRQWQKRVARRQKPASAA